MFGGTTVDPSLALLLLLLTFCSSAASGDGVFRLLVLHTNDMHSHFDQSDRDGSGSGEMCGRACYGGFARVKAAADRERSLAASRPDVDGALFLNAGDSFQGTPFFTYFGWPVVARMVNGLGIDVASLGNHEFDNGVEDARLYVRNLSAPVVACNLDLSGEPLLANEPNLMKSKVLTVNGHKVGIIGYLTPETASIASVGKIQLLPEVLSITTEAKRLKNDGVNILIALGHSGFEMDVEIAKHVVDIDLVIGGHSNTFLYTGIPPDIEKPVDQYPFWVEQPNTRRKVPVVQAFHITKYLGKLWVEFDATGEVIKSYGNPILLDSSIEQDHALSNEVEYLRERIAIQTRQVLGSSSVLLEGANERCRMRECNFGNFVTDSYIDYNLRKNIKSFDLTKCWTDAPIAIFQSGGVRMNINGAREKGNVTYGSLLSTMPFKNNVGTITTKGSSIWKALEHSVWRYNGLQHFGEFLQVSGLKVVIDLGRPSGKRVISVDARCGNCVIPVYEKLDLNANYTILMSNYLADGGDNYTFEKVVEFRDLGVKEIDIVIEEMRIKSPIRPEIGSRIVLLNAEKLQKTNGQLVSAPLSRSAFLLAVVAWLMNASLRNA